MSTSGTNTVSSANATSIAQAMTNTTTTLPFLTRADIVNNFMTNSAITSMSSIKTEEESAVRAVAESSNTRTWTFLIDIIAQSGRYPTTAGSLDSFVVEGERRYWLHVSIDRYTGQVVDKQLEVVNE
jgi:chloramphenicol 3-O-phosphotransferase